MSEILCPICGHPNPEHAVVCEQCGAKLHAEEETILPGQEPVKKNTAELERALPAWLRGAREAAQQEPETPEEKIESPVEKAPPPKEEKEDDLPSWLDGMTSEEEEEEEVPEWLSLLQSEGESDSASEAEEGKPASSTLPEETESPEPEPSAESGLPDWLSALQSESSIEETSPDLPLDSFASSSDEAEEETSAQETEDLRASLGVGEDFAAGFSESEETEQPIEEENFPDWLSDMSGGEAETETPAAEIPTQEEPAQPAESESLPDWLSDMSGGEAEAETPAVEIPASEEPKQLVESESLPDWLSDMSDGEAESKTPAVEISASEEPVQPAEGESLPGWLSDMSGGEAESVTPAVEIPASEESAQPAEGESLPDWLSDMSGSEAETETSAVEIPASEEAAQPAEGESLPDWLSEAVEESPPAPAEEETLSEKLSQSLEESSAEAAAPIAGEAPDWLESLPAVESDVPESETPALIFDEAESLSSDESAEVDEALFGEMPDWLSMLTPEEEETAPESASAEAEPENLESAALPDWIRNMRPVEAVVPETPLEESEETYAPPEEGPLAGLSGVLPAGPGIGQVSKPKPQSLKLQINERQQAQATALEQILAAETTPKALPPEEEKSISRLLLRWLIAAILVLTVGASTLLKTRLAPTPSMYPISVMDALNTLNALPENAPVLVLVEYEPGLSGEVESVALPVMEHAMLRGARLALISTQPTGFALGEHLLAKLNETYGYQRGEQYINLGYLPGNASGAQAFAANPPFAVQETMDGLPAWNTPVLQDVHTLSDFAMVLLLTDRPETAQMWIEQTRGALNGTPLILVSSAQANPVLVPYYNSGQVTGIVSGLDGGLAYESLNGRSETNRLYWDAYSLGLLVAEIFIFVGAIWGLLSPKRSKKSSGEEA